MVVGIVLSQGAWALVGIIVTQIGALLGIAIGVRRSGAGRKAAQSSETATERMEKSLKEFAERNDNAHDAMLQAHPQAASITFRVAYEHDSIAAYELVPNMDAEFNYDMVWANRAAEELWGFTFEEARLQHPSVVHADDLDRIQSGIQEAARLCQPITMRYRNVNLKNQEVTSVVSRMEPYHNLGGGVAGWIGTIWEDE
jgi:PAS domain-containing protein